LYCIQKGEQAASLYLAQQYVEKFGNLAKTNNTIIMPADVSNVNNMVVQVKISSSLHLTLIRLRPDFFCPNTSYRTKKGILLSAICFKKQISNKTNLFRILLTF
jgi:hypothetical protein